MINVASLINARSKVKKFARLTALKFSGYLLG